MENFYFKLLTFKPLNIHITINGHPYTLLMLCDYNTVQLVVCLQNDCCNTFQFILESDNSVCVRKDWIICKSDMGHFLIMDFISRDWDSDNLFLPTQSTNCGYRNGPFSSHRIAKYFQFQINPIVFNSPNYRWRPAASFTSLHWLC